MFGLRNVWAVGANKKVAGGERRNSDTEFKGTVQGLEFGEVSCPFLVWFRGLKLGV
jgi:hypothetical protein